MRWWQPNTGVGARRTPLCPAGHLPLKGGDWLIRLTAPILQRWCLVPSVDAGAISPLEGEMPGRAEGGVKHRLLSLSWRFALLPALAVLLSACDEMSHQPRYDSYEKSSLFADGKALQAPPEGTVARDDPAWRTALEQRPPMSLALIKRGRERFGIYCTPCHDYAGYGHGMVPARGFPQPPSFHEARLRNARSRYFVDVITHGHGVMYSYANRVAPADRWAIAAYIRALQLSQDAPMAMLDAEERKRLEAQ